MKLFERHGGYYLFWTGFVYFWVGMYLAFTHSGLTQYATLAWIIVLSLPFVIPPFGRWLNMSIDWDKNMFDFFRRKTAKEYMDEASNVYNLPKPKAVETPAPAPEKEEPAKIFYRLGLTDNNRVAFSMGYSEITMNRSGCQQMIDQLKFFQSQLTEEFDDPDNDPDGGEPVPVPEKEQRAA